MPANKELCIKGIAWEVLGASNANATLGIYNTNVDGSSFWVMWSIRPTLNSDGSAGGYTALTVGPRVTTNGGVSLFSENITSLTFAMYGIERDMPALGAETPCFP